ncbi:MULTISPECIES: hypothetical protein [unclassified Devosia]|uniref:hypothetical protein n=1 Tax=unclassified Devosia TaxID=196773 RepID=UPI0008689DF3|nr:MULTISPECIES: hypothetical protein [unclassified Devosia]MBN9364872.1 hypothetical protein [Devosia sp.]ODS90291.1 MAG: hypothetical protein ABS47_08610 [Devosia sp. SCN 66-27]OJX25716.1 MAG: hypothetical protein BGO83_12950 [Devosia sp. 66-14]
MKQFPAGLDQISCQIEGVNRQSVDRVNELLAALPLKVSALVKLADRERVEGVTEHYVQDVVPPPSDAIGLSKQRQDSPTGRGLSCP